MLKRPYFQAIIGAVLLAAAFVIAGPAGPARAAPVRIMPLGDSITGSPGCWRALLWNRLQTTGFTNIDFVGTLPPQGCGVAHDGDNEGHGGALATAVADQNQLPGWLSATRPDVVIMHFGTNDVWSARSTETVLAAYSKLVDQMRASNPSMRVVVAQLIPLNPPTCADCGQRVVALNAAIPGWASAKSTAQSPITVVDQWTGFSTGTDTGDGVHPNDAGSQKIANRWYPALTAVLSGVPTPTGTTPTPPPVTTTPPPGPSGGCTATYRIVNQWQGAFQGEVQVTNTGAAAIPGWTARFTFANGQQISQLWGGTPTVSAATVSVRNLGWNGSLAPPATATTFGFVANWTGSNTVPPVTCTVG